MTTIENSIKNMRLKAGCKDMAEGQMKLAQLLADTRKAASDAIAQTANREQLKAGRLIADAIQKAEKANNLFTHRSIVLAQRDAEQTFWEGFAILSERLNALRLRANRLFAQASKSNPTKEKMPQPPAFTDVQLQRAFLGNRLVARHRAAQQTIAAI